MSPPPQPFTTCPADAAAIKSLAAAPALDPTQTKKLPSISQSVMRWYEGSGVNPWMNNWVVPYIYGRCAFQDMADAIATARDPGHRIYLMGWWVDPDTRLSEGTPPLLLRDLLSVVKAQIRGMFWEDPVPQTGFADNRPIVAFLNGLRNGAAIHDHKLPFLRFAGAPFGIRGVHHQKLLVVNGAAGLIAFTGGMDINNSRVNVSVQEPLHDVHFRVTGTAANQLLRLFAERWLDHPDSTALDRARFGLEPQDVKADFETIRRQPPSTTPIATCTGPTPKTAPSHAVAIGRTYANLRKFNGTEFYSFLPPPGQEETAWQLIENAIRNAQKLIYIEDQYFVSRRLKNALLGKLREPQFRSLIVLTEASKTFEHESNLLDFAGTIPNEIPFMIAARNEIRADFATVDPQRRKWRIYNLKQATDAARREWCGSVVHSKTMIFDDECAVIGTVNANDRGYTFDTEIAASITDDALGRAVCQRFARNLRINLWPKHLAVPHQQLVDWDAGARLWQTPPAGAMVVDASALEDSPQLGAKPILRDIPAANKLWSETVDPDADLLK
jgi:phosphatidylserine/phosphatidylglycerophosphate/cardiolipin synthase-like enzyme